MDRRTTRPRSPTTSIDCELRGLGFGGLARALSVLERAETGPPPTPIRTTHETPVSAALDGGDQVGYLVATRATEIAIAKARDHGLAVVGARNTWYTGCSRTTSNAPPRPGWSA